LTDALASILTLGEGLHNSHHYAPRDACISLAWHEIDITGLIIRGLGKLGLVQDIFEGRAQATRSGSSDGGQRSMAEQEGGGVRDERRRSLVDGTCRGFQFASANGVRIQSALSVWW
jgi:hypothetical protein